MILGMPPLPIPLPALLARGEGVKRIAVSGCAQSARGASQESLGSIGRGAWAGPQRRARFNVNFSRLNKHSNELIELRDRDLWRKGNAMRFLRRHQSLVLAVAVLLFCSVMVVRQYLLNHSAHVELREDFLLLHERGSARETERLYQMLVQELPSLNTRGLVEDLQRTAMLIDSSKSQPENFVWKYHQCVKNEMFRRSETRAAQALKRASQD